MNTTSNRIDQFFRKLDAEILPGTKGAPQRRERSQKIRKAHDQHSSNLDGAHEPVKGNPYFRPFRRTDRNRSRYCPIAKSMVPVGILRHGPCDPFREKAGRIFKMHTRLYSIIKNAPIEDLARWTKALNIDLNRFAREGGHHIKQYIDIYPAAKADHRIYRGKIYRYAENTAWEKYGKKTYPRTECRRIEIIDRNRGIVQAVYLGSGEKVESALNRLIPSRSKKLAADRSREKRAAARARRREINTPHLAHKIVERNGKLRSVYDPKMVYPVARWIHETPKPDHGGGLYCYATADEAIEASQKNEVFNDAWTAGKTLVLCSCRRKGKTILYGNKIASEWIKIESVVMAINHG